MHKFTVRTLGCKVNQVESQAIREQLTAQGFSESDSDYDLAVINTCTVTDRADSESRNLIRRLLREKPQAKIIVTGCYAEKDREAISQIEGVSLVVPQSRKKNLVQEILDAAGTFPLPILTPALSGDGRGGSEEDISISNFPGAGRAFLKIQDGCNNHCSYCKVKVVRGSSKSRLPSVILKEARSLIEAGFKEIVLTGIQLGAFGKDLTPRTDIVSLLKDLTQIPGLLRVRLSSIEPLDVTEELINMIALEEKVAKHLHIPMQSGSARILGLMRRGYSKEFYFALIEKITGQVPDFCLSTDVIVGFPGETDEDFAETCDTVRQTAPLRVHIFPFSPREGTAAYAIAPRVSDAVKKARAKTLAALALEMAEKRKKDFFGRPIQVLIESRDEASGLWQGHTTHYLPVAVKNDNDLVNQEIEVVPCGLRGEYLI